MRSWNSIAAIVGAGALCACTTVGPNFKTPAAPPASAYAMAGDARPVEAVLSPDARAAGPWWRSLGSPELDAVMAGALSDNQTVATAVAAVEKARGGDAKRAAAASRRNSPATLGAERERVNLAQFGFTLPFPIRRSTF